MHILINHHDLYQLYPFIKKNSKHIPTLLTILTESDHGQLSSDTRTTKMYDFCTVLNMLIAPLGGILMAHHLAVPRSDGFGRTLSNSGTNFVVTKALDRYALIIKCSFKVSNQALFMLLA
jgi:hypothetical protein